MDIYGNPIEGGSSLENGGTIDGSLEIKQDLQVDGNVVIDGSLTVDTIISDLDVEDALITCGVNNPQDLLNTGLLMGHNFSTTARYGGIVRRATDKRLVALQSVAPKPTPTSIIASSDAVVECAELATDKILSDTNNLAIDSNTIKLNSSSFITYDGLGNQAIASVANIDFIVQGEKKLTLNANDGGLSLNCQNNPNADMLLTSGRDVKIRGGLVNTSDVLIEARNGDITLKSTSDFLIDCPSQLDLDCGVVKVNRAPNSYFLPADKGSPNQVLTTNGLGATSWQTPTPLNPFDQTLNTTDAVRFSQLDIGTVGGGFTMPLARGTPGQYMRQNVAGIVSWVDFPAAAHGVMSMVGNALPTAFVGAGLYTQIVGTRTGSQLLDFAFAPNVLQYTGLESAEFQVNVSQSWIHASGTPDQFRLAVFINGAIVASSEQRCNLDSDSDYPRSSSTNAIVSLSNGDQIDVRIANFTDTTTCTVIDHTFSIVKVGLTASGGGSNPFDQSLNTSDSPAFAGLTVPTLTAEIQDINVSARELTVQNPIAGPTTLEVRSNGAGDAVLAFTENQSGFWEIYKDVNNNLNISSQTSGDDVISIADIGNTIQLKKQVSIGSATPYTLPTTRGTLGQVLKETTGGGLVQWSDLDAITAPVSATDRAITIYDGISGDLVQNSDTAIDTRGEITASASVFNDGQKLGGLIHSKINTTVVSATTSETDVMVYGTLPSGHWQVGDTIHVEVWGLVSNTAGSQLNFRFYLHNGLISQGFSSLALGTGRVIRWTADLTFRAVGVLGNFYGTTKLEVQDSGSSPSIFYSNNDNRSCDTTNTATPSRVSAQWSSSAGNTLEIQGGFVMIN